MQQNNETVLWCCLSESLSSLLHRSTHEIRMDKRICHCVPLQSILPCVWIEVLMWLLVSAAGRAPLSAHSTSDRNSLCSPQGNSWSSSSTSRHLPCHQCLELLDGAFPWQKPVNFSLDGDLSVLLLYPPLWRRKTEAQEGWRTFLSNISEAAAWRWATAVTQIHIKLHFYKEVFELSLTYFFEIRI